MADDVKEKKVDVDKHGKPKPVEFKDDKGRALMNVKVYAPFKSYFDEPAYSISAENATGPFDILPHHHNFMTLISACEMKIIAPTGEKLIRINRAVMHVKADKVVVFLDV
jgi:F0F1-type ATP synthase epsilon subunit